MASQSVIVNCPYSDNGTFWLRDNLYWNDGQPIPYDAGELINYTDDVNGVVGDPLLGAQAGLVLPRWDRATSQFAHGSATIREAFERLVLLYGMPAEGSPAIDDAEPLFASAEDILGHPRLEGGAPDIGAVERAPPLVLHGVPGDGLVRLSWTLEATLPATSTWQISYDGLPGDQPSPIVGIGEPTRAYTLTGLTNYAWYTVTLRIGD